MRNLYGHASFGIGIEEEPLKEPECQGLREIPDEEADAPRTMQRP